MMELAVRAFGLCRQDTHFNSLSSNLFHLFGKTAEILQLNYAKGGSSLYAGNMSPKLHGVEALHWNGNEMGSTWCKSTALERK